MNWISKIKAKASRRAIVSVLALATTASFGTYEMIKPVGARAATAAPAAAALDPDSVTALTALDHAMETVAARRYAGNRERGRDFESEGIASERERRRCRTILPAILRAGRVRYAADAATSAD